MRKVVLLMLMISSILATQIKQNKLLDKHYAIKLGVFKKLYNAKKLSEKFLNENTYISLRTHSIDSYHHLFIVNIKTKKEAYKKLKNIQNIVKDAFVVLKRTEFKEKKSIDKYTNNSTKSKPDITSKLSPTILNNDINISNHKDTNQTEIKNTPNTGLLLKDAILKALNKSDKIQSAKQKVIQAKYKLIEKQAGHKPKVILYATGGDTYQNVKDNIEQTFINGATDLSVTQNLYAGGRVSNNIKKEKQNLKIAAFKFRESVEKEILSIIESYINIIYEKKGIKANRKNMKDLQKILNIVTIKEQSGAASKGDLNYIKSNVENAASALVKAESKYQNAISYYEYFIGSCDKNHKPSQNKFDIKLADQNSTIKKMNKYNAKIKIAKAKIKMQKYDMRSRKASFRPNLDLIINAKRKATRAKGVPLEDKANAVLSLNYNLYNGGKDKAILLKSKSKIAQLQYKLKDVEQSTLFNTKQMYENTNSAQYSLSHTQKEVQANEKVTQAYWDAFKYGEQDIQALLLAQRALNRSQLDEIKEKKEFILGLYKLLGQTGELVEKVGVSDFVNPKKIGNSDNFWF